MPDNPPINEIKCDNFTEIPLSQTLPLTNEARGFCHTSQIDWLKTIKGECVLTLFYNKKFMYVPMYKGMSHYVEVGRKVWHGALNFDSSTAQCYNLLFRQGRPAHVQDYRIRVLPFEHNLEAAKLSLMTRNIILYDPKTTNVKQFLSV
jgi:hypothetical protein